MDGGPPLPHNLVGWWCLFVLIYVLGRWGQGGHKFVMTFGGSQVCTDILEHVILLMQFFVKRGKVIEARLKNLMGWRHKYVRRVKFVMLTVSNDTQ